MSRGVVVDTSAWQFYFRKRSTLPDFAASLADEVEELFRIRAVWIHPVVAGEVRIGGVDPMDAFDGLPWLPGTSDQSVLTWLLSLARPRGVGWADVCVVHGALTAGLDLVTGDAGQERFWRAARASARS